MINNFTLLKKENDYSNHPLLNKQSAAPVQTIPGLNNDILDVNENYTFNFFNHTRSRATAQSALSTNSKITFMKTLLSKYRLIAVAFTMAGLFFVSGAWGADRYSVATGNWNSISTWSETSGGLGGASVPGSGDNVIIDKDVTVTVNIGNAACASLTLITSGINNKSKLVFINTGVGVLTVGGTVTLGGNSSGNVNTQNILDMTNVGTLTCTGFAIGVVAGSNVFTPGAGTVEMSTTNTLPSTVFTSFNNLKVSSGTTTSGVSFSVAGTLTVGGTLDIGTTTLTISGTGTGTVQSGGVLMSAGTVTTTGPLTFQSGGKYQHNFTTTAGTIPTATWNSGSTCEIIGYTTNSTAPGGLGQTFSKFSWNVTGQTGNINLAGALTTVNSDFSFSNTNTGIVRLATSQTSTLTVGGNFTFSAGTMEFATTTGNVTLDITGNYSQSAGTVSLSPSGGTASVGTIKVKGDFSITGAGTITKPLGGGTGKIIFQNASGSQSFSSTSGGINTHAIGVDIGTGSTTNTVNLTSAIAINSSASLTVKENATLNCSTNTITGGTFVVSGTSPGGTLGIGSTAGITTSGATGNVQTTTRTFNAGANYTYNGTGGVQASGNGLTTANNLTANNPAGVNISTSVTVNGSFLVTNTGTVDVNGGTTTLGGSASMQINPLATFQVSSGGTATFAARPVTIKSDGTGTGRIGTISGTFNTATNVTCERYIPQRSGLGRAYRLLTAGVNTSGSMRTNWMEGGLVTTVGGTSNPVAGFGTHITGAGGNTNNFDVTQTNQSSIYTAANGGTSSTLVYTAVPNASSTMSATQGYFLFVRGNRSESLSILTTPGMPTSATTLRANGTVLTGTQTSFGILEGGAGSLNMVTNPYPSPIDWALVKGASSNIGTSYTIWDPNFGSRGGFVTINTSGVASSGAGTKFIQSGQAFFVESDGGLPSVSIQETHKSAGNNNGVFTPVTQYESFRTELYYTEQPSGFRRIADGVIAVYNNSYSAGIDANDASEIGNWDENIAIARDGKHLAIESRPVIVSKDTLPLFMNNMREMAYEFEFTPSAFTNIGLKAELIDKFLSTRTQLSVTAATVVSFTVTADPASKVSDRFMVVFGPQVALAVDDITIKANKRNNGVQVDWTSRTETDMDRYEVERSANGTNFARMTTSSAIGNSSGPVSYSWLDASPLAGNNFYRIKGFDQAGTFKYSQVVKVLFGKDDAGIVVYPNPIKGNSFSLDMNNLAKGMYRISLVNTLGQEVFVQSIQHDGSMMMRTITMQNEISQGSYQLVLAGENGLKLTQKIIKN